MLATSLWTMSAHANNGHVAIGMPVTGIVADGDLSDWPSDIERQPLHCNHYGDAPESDADLSAWAQFGYDIEAAVLYVGVTVRDDSHIAESSGADEDWNSRDSAGVYLTFNHGRHGSPVDEAFTIRDGPIVGIGRRGDSRRQGDVTTYEWKFDLNVIEAVVDLKQPFTAALCVEATDKDEDGSISINYWSPLAWKKQSASRAGDLILGVRKNTLGRIQGTLLDHDLPNAFGATIIRFASVDNPNLVMDVMTDALGAYTVRLPAGRYVRSIKDWASDRDQATIEVQAGRTTTDQAVRHPPTGRILGLGPGKTNPLGTPSSTFLIDAIKDHAYTARQYSTASGLPNGTNRDVITDHQDSLWIANSGGLVKFDGQSTTIYGVRDGLPHDRVNCLLFENENAFWLGTDNGLAQISLRRNSIHVFAELVGKHINHVARIHDGRLGIATERGFYVWDGQQMSVFGKSSGLDEIRCLSCCSDISNKFTWVGTNDGLSQFDGQKITANLTRQHGLPDGRVWAIHRDKVNNAMWFGANRSIFCWDGKKYTTITSSNVETYRNCDSFTQDDRGLVWANTYNDQQNSVVAFSRPSPDAVQHEFSSAATHVSSDRIGNIWVSGGGFIKQVDRTRIRVSNSWCPVVVSDPHRQGSVWYAGAEGGDQDNQREDGWYLRRMEGLDVVESFPCKYAIRSLIMDKHRPNHAWVGTKTHGLLLFDGKTFSIPNSGLAQTAQSKQPRWPTTHRIFDLKYLSNGQLWCAATDGIYVLQDDCVVAKYDSSTGLPVSRVEQIEQCGPNKVVCASYSGAFFVDIHSGSLLGRIGPNQGLPDNYAVTVHPQDDGSVWIGTFKGLYRYMPDGTITSIPTSKVLQSTIGRIFQDARKHLWVTSALGITKVDPISNVVQPLFSVSGQSSKESFSWIELADDYAWIASNYGLLRCRYAESSPHLRLESKMPGVRAETSLQSTSDDEEIQVHFQAFSLTTPADEFVYRYRLKGIDREWHHTTESTLQYKTPKQGNYTFEIQALDRDLQPSPVLMIPYRVVPPYAKWITNGALSSSLFACVFMVVMHVRKIGRLNRDLERRVQERTAETLDALEEKRRLREELLHSQKMESLGTMAAGMAHDFNNALCAIGNNAELGLMQMGNVDHIRESLDEIVAATEQAGAITKSLLTFAGKTVTQKEKVRLELLVKDAMRLVRRTIPASIQIQHRGGEQPIWCHADVGQLKQVIINLAMNSRDAMPNGGTIVLTVGTLTVENETRACVRIEDNGCGMDSATSLRVFEPFFTRKPRGKGTGLGLSVVRSIIAAHEGEITVASQLGKGTTFEFFLPICDSPERTISSTTEAREVCKRDNNKTIVVADDELRVRTAISRAIRRTGFDVIEVGTGLELLDITQREAGRISLVIVDVDMPKVDGFTASQKLRQQNQNLPIIVVTGMPTEVPIELLSKATVLLRKPFPLGELLNHIASLTANKDELIPDKSFPN